MEAVLLKAQKEVFVLPHCDDFALAITDAMAQLGLSKCLIKCSVHLTTLESHIVGRVPPAPFLEAQGLNALRCN